MHVKPVFVTAHLGSDFLGTEVKHEVDMHENVMLTKSRIILCFYTKHRRTQDAHKRLVLQFSLAQTL